MANLLTTQQKKKTHREWKLRFLFVALWGIFILFVCGTLFLVPSYILVRSKEHAIEDRIESTKALIASRDGDIVHAAAEETRVHLEQLSTYLFDVTTPLETIEMVTNAQDASITLFDIAYEEGEEKGVVSVSLVGVADTRDTLLSFVDRLEAEERIIAVNLPLSHLAERVDISFQITFSIETL